MMVRPDSFHFEIPDVGTGVEGRGQNPWGIAVWCLTLGPINEDTGKLAASAGRRRRQASGSGVLRIPTASEMRSRRREKLATLTSASEPNLVPPASLRRR